MGAWGPNSFENDHACDWREDLIEENDPSFIEQTLDAVLSAPESGRATSLEEEGVAAADVVARMLGRFGQRGAFTERLDEWVKVLHATPADSVVQKAVKVVDIIRSPQSELAQLWCGDEGWHDAMDALRQRLTG